MLRGDCKLTSFVLVLVLDMNVLVLTVKQNSKKAQVFIDFKTFFWTSSKDCDFFRTNSNTVHLKKMQSRYLIEFEDSFYLTSMMFHNIVTTVAVTDMVLTNALRARQLQHPCSVLSVHSPDYAKTVCVWCTVRPDIQHTSQITEPSPFVFIQIPWDKERHQIVLFLQTLLEKLHRGFIILSPSTETGRIAWRAPMSRIHLIEDEENGENNSTQNKTHIPLESSAVWSWLYSWMEWLQNSTGITQRITNRKRRMYTRIHEVDSRKSPLLLSAFEIQ